MNRSEVTEDADPGAGPLEMSGAEFRRLGHHLVDRLADFLDSLPDLPAAPDTTPRQVRGRLGQGGLPQSGAAAAGLLDQAADLLIDYSRLNGHPKSWGYVIGSPAPIGMLGDFLASTVNPNLAAWNSSPIASEIEAQVVRWIAELLGYSQDCGGLLVSGGNMANFVGFLAARRARAGWFEAPFCSSRRSAFCTSFCSPRRSGPPRPGRTPRAWPPAFSSSPRSPS